MFKETIKRVTFGIILGVFIFYTITIINSLINNNGNYYPVSTNLIKHFNSEIAAVIVQYLLSALLGAVYGGTTLFWEIDNWSLVRQTVSHFCTTTVTMLIVGLLCNWIPFTFTGIAIWIGIFIVTYLIVWFICYSTFKRKVTEINKELNKA